MFRSEPGSRPDNNRGGKSELHMAAGPLTTGRGDPTESATENKPPRYAVASRSKGEKAGQEPTVSPRERRELGKPPAEQDQIREEFPSRSRSGRNARLPVSLDSRVGRYSSAAMSGTDKWLPLSRSAGKTEFGLPAHSVFYFKHRKVFK